MSWESLGNLPLAFLRASGFAAILPFPFSGFGLDKRLLLSLILALSTFSPQASMMPSGLFALPYEFFLGLLFALPVALLFSAIEMWAEFFDVGRGENFAALYDPQTSRSHHAMTLFLRALLGILLVAGGMYETLFSQYDALSNTFPFGSSPLLLLDEVGELILSGIAQVMMMTFRFFLPLSCLYLTVDFGVGCIGRVVKGVPLHGEAFALKTLLGLIAVLALCFSGIEESLLVWLRDLNIPDQALRTQGGSLGL
ncbi:MAG: flagellar biosynthetic protein FliR [Bdellovibrionales bacterium]|nr:flagellar biosynthetic protein FliR [Bdellovibrionales bacterium]